MSNVQYNVVDYHTETTGTVVLTLSDPDDEVKFVRFILVGADEVSSGELEPSRSDGVVYERDISLDPDGPVTIRPVLTMQDDTKEYPVEAEFPARTGGSISGGEVDGPLTVTGSVSLATGDPAGPALEVGNYTFQSLEDATIRTAARLYPRPLGSGVDESAGLYIRIDPAGSANQLIGIYGEITTEQQDTEAAFLKVIHKGAGDALYVAVFGAGAAAIEAASFVNGSKGIISTVQTEGQGSSVLFNALWDHATVPAYGMFYADQAPGHALTIHKRTGANDGVAQIRLIESDLQQVRFSVMNDGRVIASSLAASASAPVQESPEIVLRGSAWDGSSAQNKDVVLKNAVGATGSVFFLLVDGSYKAVVSATQWDLQLSDLVQVDHLGARTLTLGTGSEEGLPLDIVDALRTDWNTASGETRLLIWDIDAGTLKRVKRTASGAVSGVSGRVLYID